MRLTLAGIALAAALTAAPLRAAVPPQLPIQELRLSNGMRFLLLELPGSTTVAAGWVVRAGPANESEGSTGLSHLIEHMLFQGSRRIGSKDPEKEWPLLDEQDAVRAERRSALLALRDAARKGGEPNPDAGAAAEKRQQLDQRLAELRQRLAELRERDALHAIYTRNGVDSVKADSGEDWTAFVARVPANRLELWAWLESDRLLEPAFRELDTEREAIAEERRAARLRSALAPHEDAFNEAFWGPHPYARPRLGKPQDLATLLRSQAREFFAAHYAPDNLTGVLVGDLQGEALRPLLERYFGRLRRASAAAPEPVAQAPAQLAEKRHSVTLDGPPAVRIWWRAVPFAHQDRAAYGLLAELLSGRDGRLERNLVQRRALATAALADADLRRHGGAFKIEAALTEGVQAEAAEAALLEEIERLKQEPLSEAELARCRNAIKSSLYSGLNSPLALVMRLLSDEGRGDARYLTKIAEELDAVSPADLQRVAKAGLTRENRTVGTFLRRQVPVTGDPEIEALPASARELARLSLERIKQETDVAKIRNGIEALKGLMSQAPGDVRAAFQLIIKRGEQRLAELEKKP